MKSGDGFDRRIEEVGIHAARCAQELLAACRATCRPTRDIHLRMMEMHLEEARDIIASEARPPETR